jgi:hypothetical protein
MPVTMPITGMICWRPLASLKRQRIPPNHPTLSPRADPSTRPSDLSVWRSDLFTRPSLPPPHLPTSNLGVPTKKLGLPTKNIDVPTRNLGLPTSQPDLPTSKVGVPT